MKAAFLAAAGLSLLFSTGSAHPRPPADAEAEIRRIDDEWSRDLAARRLDEVMANYADDAAFLVPNRPIVQGKAAIRAWFETQMATPGYTATFRPTSIVVSASQDLAYEIGTFAASARDAEGRTVHSVGKHLVAWQKRDGRWRVVAESISGDGPPRPAN